MSRTTRQIRAGARIFKGDEQIARVAKSVVFQGPRSFFELNLPSTLPVAPRARDTGLEMARDEARVALLTLEYERGPIQVWQLQGELTPEQIEYTDLLDRPE